MKKNSWIRTRYRKETNRSPKPVLRIRDPVPFCPLDPGSVMGKKSGSGPRDKHHGSYFQKLGSNFWFKILKIFYVDPDPGSGIFLTLDPGWKHSDPGSGINIPDP